MTALRVLVAALLSTALLPLAEAEAPLLAGRLVLNEVLYDPAGTESGAEAFEIFNPTTEAVDLAGWTATDGDLCRPVSGGDLTTYALALEGVVPALGHLVVTIPSVGSVPKCLSLANGGDDLRLVAPDGSVVDEVSWTSSGGNGLSLQRCAATDGHTHAAPTLGAPNSLCV